MRLFSGSDFIISIFCVFVNESLKPNKDYEEIPLVQLGIENIHAGLEEFVYENHFDYWEFYWGGMNAFTDKMTIIADSVGIDSVSTMERDRQYDEAVDETKLNKSGFGNWESVQSEEWQTIVPSKHS